MKKLFLAIFVLFSLASSAQILQPINQWGYQWNRGNFINLLGFPQDTFAVPTSFKQYSWTAAKHDSIYVWRQDQNKWKLASSTGSGGFLGSNVSIGNAAEATFHDSVGWWKNDTTLILRKFEFLSADSKLSITYPAGSRNTDSTTSLLFTVNPANILLSSLGGSLNLSQIAQGSATTGQVPMWNGSSWVPSSVSGSGSETDPISIHNQRAVQANSFFNVNTGTFRDTAFFKGGAYITNYDAAGVNASWLVLPNGVSGIGFNGTGVDVVVGHTQFGGQFFTNSSSGDIAFRNTAADLDFGTGTGSGPTTMKIVFASQTVQIAKAANTIILDTTAGKPLVVNTSGQVIGRGYWYGPSGGGGGSTPTLQQVSDAGSSTTTAITVEGIQLSTSTITNTTAAFINLFGNNAGGVTFSFASTHKATIGQGLLTADRGYDLPDASGTLALTNQTMPTGGTAGQVLSKIDGTNYNTQWVTPSGGGGGLSGLTTNNVPYATSSTTIGPSGSASPNGIYWDNTNNRLLINKTSGSFNVDVTGSIHGTGAGQIDASMTVGGTYFQQSVFSMGTGSSPFFEFVNSWASNGSFRFKGASGSTSILELNGDQTIKAPGYAGTGNRNAYFDVNGVWQRGSVDPANIQQIATVATALTAAGTNQSTALALSGSYSIQEVTTTASGTGVKLPTATAASWIFVVNRGANDLVVYPNTSGVINGQSANAGFTVQAGSTSVFIGKDGTSWYTEQAYRGGDVANADGNKALTINANAVTTTKINDAAVTYAKIQNVTAIRLLGRFTNSNGVAQEITIGTGLALDNTTGALSATGGGGGMSNPMTTLGDIIYEDGTPAAARLAGNTTSTKKVLTQTGTGSVSAAPAWGTLSNSDVGLGNVENTALSTWAGTSNITTLGTVTTGTWSATTIAISKGGTGQTTAAAAFDALSPNTTLGDLAYRGSSSNVRLAGNTSATKKFLVQTGTGSVSAAPAWDVLVAGDIPDISASYIKNQSASSQTGSFWLSGNGKLDGSLTATSIAIGGQGNISLGGSPYMYWTNGWANQGGFKIWGAAGGTLLMQMDYTQTITMPGNVVVGSGSATGMTEGTKLDVLLDNSANGIQTSSIRVNQTASSTNVTSALQPWLRTTHASGTVADVRTFVPVYDQGSANAVTEARVVDASALMSATSGGTITTLKIFSAKLSANTSTATTITNTYGYYYDAQGGSGTITSTNPAYAFYNNDATAQSLFKGKVFLPSLGTTTSDKLVGILASSGDLANITLGAGLSLSGNTLTSSVSNGSLTVINDADYTVAAGITAVVYKTMTAGRTVTLPAASSNTNRIITITNGGGGSFNITLSVAIKQNSSTTTTTLIPNKWAKIQSDGTDWWIIANN